MRWIRCLVCDQESRLSDLFCVACRHEMGRSTYSRAEPVEWLGDLKLNAAVSFEGAWARYIRLTKTQNGKLIQPTMLDPLRALVGHWAVECRRHQFDSVIAVPSQRWREFSGFALSRWLATEMARLLEIPQLGLKLQKTDPWFTDGQKSKARASRLKNHEAFSLQKPRGWSGLSGRVLLIDDICTSGASVRACADLLNDTGLDCSRAWVLARTPYLADRTHLRLKIGVPTYTPAQNIRYE